MREEIIKRLRQLQQENIDIEGVHEEADKLLCELLTSCGYEDVVREWDEVPKWYA